MLSRNIFKTSLGSGSYIFTSGDKYIGQIQDGQFGPYGEFFYANGDHYIGEWKDLKRHGQGNYISRSNFHRYFILTTKVLF